MCAGSHVDGVCVIQGPRAADCSAGGKWSWLHFAIPYLVLFRSVDGNGFFVRNCGWWYPPQKPPRSKWVIAFYIFILPQIWYSVQNDGMFCHVLVPSPDGNGVFTPGSPPFWAGMGRSPGLDPRAMLGDPQGLRRRPKKLPAFLSCGYGTAPTVWIGTRRQMSSITYKAKSPYWKTWFWISRQYLVSHTGILPFNATSIEP